MNTEKAPYGTARKLLLWCLNTTKKRSEREDNFHDIFGTETLSFLIGSLAAINAPTKIWGQLADHLLEIANGGLGIYYEPQLLSIADHVSKKKLGVIVDYFVQQGRVDAVVMLTTKYLHRNPLQTEVMTMAEYHSGEESFRWTNPDNKVWEKLFSLSSAEDSLRIRSLHEKASKRQKESASCIY